MPNTPPAASDAATDPARVPVRIWDLPTRLFHWALAILVTIAWISGTRGAMELHLLAGYGVLALVLFRLLWGVLGSESARFATFSETVNFEIIRRFHADGIELASQRRAAA